MDEQDLFEEIDNNFGLYEKEFENLCPHIDDELIKYLRTFYGEELSFNKDVDFNEYQYRTGIVEVINHLIIQNTIQKEK